MSRIEPRFFSSRDKAYYKLRKVDTPPLQVLGFKQEEVQYTQVKKKFLQIAMKHHPDRVDDDDDESEDYHRDIFIAARQAFERLEAGPDGLAILREEAEDLDEEWFRHETGHDMPFMDAATMKEVADMTESMGGGLDRDGGMWTLARMVTNSVKSGGDGGDVLRLEAGEERNKQIDGVLRRRRRR